MECKAVAFTGPSNSGKTTLIEKIAIHQHRRRSIAVIKHDPKDKAIFDQEGKDSDRFFKTGAEVAVLSPERTTLFSHRSRGIEEAARLLAPFDWLLVEGLRTLPLPRIGVFRGRIDEDYLPYVDALAVDDTIEWERYRIPDTIDQLDLNDIDGIVAWIETHAITLK